MPQAAGETPPPRSSHAGKLAPSAIGKIDKILSHYMGRLQVAFATHGGGRVAEKTFPPLSGHSYYRVLGESRRSMLLLHRAKGLGRAPALLGSNLERVLGLASASEAWGPAHAVQRWGCTGVSPELTPASRLFSSAAAPPAPAPGAAAAQLLAGLRGQEAQRELQALRQAASVVPYSELLRVCKEVEGGAEADAARLADALHRAGVVLKHGDL